MKIPPVMLMFGLVLLPLSACRSMEQWLTPNPETDAVPGEQLVDLRAEIVTFDSGFRMRAGWNSCILWLRTEDGREYKSDLHVHLISNHRWLRAVPYHPGQRGIARIGVQSDVVHEFIPDAYAREIEAHKQALRENAHAGN